MAPSLLKMIFSPDQIHYVLSGVEASMVVRSSDRDMLSINRPIRIQGFDLARAIALMAMVVVNYTSLMQIGVFSPLWVDRAVDFVFGRAAAVFVILSGISISLMFERSSVDEPLSGVRRYLMVRSLLMLLAGVILWHWWAADILHFYAAYIILGMAVATKSTRRLWQLLIIVALISMPVCAVLTVTYDSVGQSELLYGQYFGIHLVADYLMSCYYPLLPWFGYFLMGMLLGRQEKAHRIFYGRLLLASLFVCLAIEYFSNAMLALAEECNMEIEGDWKLVFLRSEAFPVTPLFVLSSAASGLALIGICRLVADIAAYSSIVKAVCCFGKLSLTMYIGHLLWGFGIVSWIEGHGGKVGQSEMVVSAGLFCAVGILFSVFWCCYFKRGPLESLFYRLSCLKWGNPSKMLPLPKA